MPRYFFHVHDSADRPDREGTVLSGVREAQVEALMFAGELISDAGLKRERGADWRIEVTDEVGLVLFRMDFTVAGSAALSQRY